jgi:hypothetical protein
MTSRFLQTAGWILLWSGVLACQAAGSTKPAAPVIKSVAPHHGMIGTSVILKGHGFKDVTQVLFDGRSASFKILNDQRIEVVVPDTEPGSITVISPEGRAEYKAFNVMP